MKIQSVLNMEQIYKTYTVTKLILSGKRTLDAKKLLHITNMLNDENALDEVLKISENDDNYQNIIDLLICTISKRPDLVKFLLSNNRYIPRRTIDIALLYATKAECIGLVELLLEYGADINTLDNEAICIACQRSNLDIIKLLLTKGADIHVRNDTPFRRACIIGNYETIKYLIDIGVNVTASKSQGLINAVNGYGTHMNLDVINILLDHGADVNTSNGMALVIACKYGHLELVKLLIKRGANVKSMNYNALRTACMAEHITIVDYIIHSGIYIDINTVNELIIDALGNRGNLFMARLLLTKYPMADINAMDKMALRLAHKNKHRYSIKFILIKNSVSLKRRV